MFRFAVLFLAMANVSWVPTVHAEQWKEPSQACPELKQNLLEILHRYQLHRECRAFKAKLNACCKASFPIASGMRWYKNREECAEKYNSFKDTCADERSAYSNHSRNTVKGVDRTCGRAQGRSLFVNDTSFQNAVSLATLYQALCDR